jgi:hypothetical protein
VQDIVVNKSKNIRNYDNDDVDNKMEEAGDFIVKEK